MNIPDKAHPLKPQPGKHSQNQYKKPIRKQCVHAKEEISVLWEETTASKPDTGRGHRAMHRIHTSVSCSYLQGYN